VILYLRPTRSTALPVDNPPIVVGANLPRAAMPVTEPARRKSEVPTTKTQSPSLIQSGTVMRPSLSPDSLSIAFIDMGHLYVRRLESTYLLDLGPSAGTPFWSPDSRSVAATVGKWLTRFDLEGSASRQLCESNTMLPGAWGPDGTILLGLLREGIFRVPATGGQLVRVTKVDPARKETRHLSPQFLPDGKHFLYVRASNERGQNMLYVGSLPSDEGKAIMPAESNVEFVANNRDTHLGYLVYQADDTLVARPFDLTTMTAAAAVVRLGEAARPTRAMDAAFSTADFSVTPSALALRSASNSGIQLTRNWMARLTR
jgi:eukaryotic-like serine/threonine-protein kinase